MKAGFLTQIMVTPVTGISLYKAFELAKELGFKMFSFNDVVYSVIAFEFISKTDRQRYSDAILFNLSDLVDYNYNS